MKSNYSILAGLAALAGFLPAAQAAIDLGSANDFAVLGASTVTSTGNTVVNGDLGISPGTAITGFGPGLVNGQTYYGDTIAAQAQIDALAAYTQILALAPAQSLTGDDLGGLILTPGIYDFASSALLTGRLTLNGQGNPNAQFIFQIGSTLTTASSASVVFENGASAGGLDWQVGSSATLGTGTAFAGNLLADQSITMNTGASLTGRALALHGAVSLDNNAITITGTPEPGSLLSAGLCAALGLGWWYRARRVAPRAAGH